LNILKALDILISKKSGRNDIRIIIFIGMKLNYYFNIKIDNKCMNEYITNNSWN